jgi:hypothetical protein
LSAQELTQWGLSNLWNEGQEGGYAVRHGQHPVCDFPPLPGAEDQSNFFEKAFPTLFPYGVGGMEALRPTHIDLRQHIQWSLRYHDRQFHCHETFIFVAYGIIQRRQALLSARLQMRRQTFERDAHILSSLKLSDFQQAVQDEMRGQLISHPAIKLLYSHIHTVAARVMGSNVSRRRQRSKVWSTTLAMNPPSLWVTYNLCDIHHPVAQIFAGEEIDMDHFDRVTGPSADQRVVNISQDPYAAALFFHYTIRAVFECLFQI